MLRGNLAPDGAVIKQSAASPELRQHRGRALVFESPEEYRAVSDDLDVDPSTVLVLRNNGPQGYPGMPEVANVGLPRELLERGVRDLVRVSDGRMLGSNRGGDGAGVASIVTAGRSPHGRAPRRSVRPDGRRPGHVTSGRRSAGRRCRSSPSPW